MIQILRNLLKDENGQGLTEYGLILGLVAVVCIGATQVLGTKVNTTLTTVGTKMP
ncbi:MAG: Flp family type IVb pilin [Candidatus Sericytochromatia bacterium]|nr:Flp family type IVb pilin [Candidatus Sericytochromatia bacterium]